MYSLDLGKKLASCFIFIGSILTTSVQASDCIGLFCEKDTIALDGEWRARIGTPEHITKDFLTEENAWRSIDIATPWDELNWAPKDNSVSYHLSLDLGKSYSDLSIFPGYSPSSYRLFYKTEAGSFVKLFENIDGKGFGEFRTGHQNLKAYELSTLPRHAEFVLQVANGAYYSGLVMEPPILGKGRVLEQNRQTRLIYFSALFGIFLILSLYNFNQWFARRTHLDQLFLSLVALVSAVRELDKGRILAEFWPDSPISINWEISWLTLFFIIISFLGILHYGYPGRFHRLFIFGMGVLASFGVALFIFVPGSTYIEYGHFLRYVMLILGPYVVYGLVREAIEDREAGRYIAIGFTITMLTSAVDIVLKQLHMTPYAIVSDAGFLIFAIVMTLYLGRRYAYTVDQLAIVTDELRLANQNLEAQVSERTKELRIANDALFKQARTDSLTGLFNRRAFDERLLEEINRVSRHENHCAFALVDADHFKKINDNFGHETGDNVLIALAALMDSEIRSTDVLGRYGGEEFVILLPETKLSDATQFLDRLRARVEKEAIISNRQKITLTISIGLTAIAPGMTLESVYRNADAGLYIAKNQGRNQVACA